MMKQEVNKKYDNFKQVMKYAEILMRNDDPYIAKKRKEHAAQTGNQETHNDVFDRLASISKSNSM